jgi:glycosyltransferase involved in cell wall biosynthesis
MKILLLGEYSRLHNTLKEGLISLGHNVTIVGDGDGFKNFPVDISTRPVFMDLPINRFIRKAIYKFFKFDLSALEKGLRFYFQLKRLKNFDVVQLINEKPIKTIPSFERYLLKKVFDNNQKTFLLSCGIDVISVDFMLQKKFRYSLMDPYFEDPKLKPEYQYILDYTSKSHRRTHNLVFENISGVVASDYDYVLPMESHRLFRGLIPNPINCDAIQFKPLDVENGIVFFLGINKGTYHKKGIPLFEKALEIVAEKFPKDIKVITAESLPYAEYIELYDEAHIILDQVYAYDQGYNALEAMAKGKVVFTGAEAEFLAHYGLSEDEVAINALPDVDQLVEKLTWLIQNPSKIEQIGKSARAFIEKEHHYIKVAKKYLETYSL